MITKAKPPRPIDPSTEEEIASYDARDLIASGMQARIYLDGQAYFLRITRAGKLILTK